MKIATICLTTFLALGSSASALAADSGACAWTRGTSRAPASSFPRSNHWHGTAKLAVVLPEGGRWRGLGPTHNFRDKLFLWSEGFEVGLEKNLKVTGVQLDAPGQQAVVSRPTNAYAESLGGWAMLVLVELPSAGCWEITGEYMGEKLKFVVEAHAERPASPPAT